ARASARHAARPPPPAGAPPRHRLDRARAGGDEVRAMAELGEDRVEQDAAVRIVFDAQNSKSTNWRMARCRALAGSDLGRLGDFVHRDPHAEPAAAAGLALHRQVTTHRLSDALDEGEPQPSAAIAARDVLVCLGEGTKQPLDFAAGKPDAAVRHRKDEPRLAARGAFAGDLEAYAPALRELHRIVDEIFQRRAQP